MFPEIVRIRHECQMVYGLSLSSCIQTPANFGVAFAVGLEALEIQNMCTGWQDEIHKDHVTTSLQQPFLFKPYIRDWENICLVIFSFLNQIRLVTFQLPSNLAGRGTREVLRSKEKISLSDYQVTTKSSFKPWDLSISLSLSLIAF